MLCPECGCLMEENENETIYHEGTLDEVTVYELVEECPCCGYSEVSYDAE